MGSHMRSILITPHDPYRSSILFFTGIALSFTIAGAGLGVGAETRSNKLKSDISNFVGQRFPGASVEINTRDLKTAGALAVVGCFLLFVWFIWVAVSTFSIKHIGRSKYASQISRKRGQYLTNAIISGILTIWLLAAVIAATVIYATKGPKIEGDLAGNAVGQDVLAAIIGQLRAIGFPLALEYRNIPRTLVRESITVQWLAWFFSTVTTIFIACATVQYYKMPDEPLTTAPISSDDARVQDPGPSRQEGDIEEKRRNEGPAVFRTDSTPNDPHGATDSEKTDREVV